MSNEPLEKLASHPAAWTVRDLEDRSQWRWVLSRDQIEEIDRALRNVKDAGHIGLGFPASLFPLPTMSTLIGQAIDQLEDGIGFVRFGGFPVEAYSTDDLRQILWGIGLYLGTPRPQDKAQTMLADVMDKEGVRGYENSEFLNFHSDPADITALFCIKTPLSGGESLLVSMLMIFNTISNDHPELRDALTSLFPWGFAGRQRADQDSWSRIPIFSVVDGKFAALYSRLRLLDAANYDDAPRLTEDQKTIMDMIDRMIKDPAFQHSSVFEAGDLQLMNNFVLSHGRQAFADSQEPSHQRHLLRLWLSTPNSRALHEGLKPVYQNCGAGEIRGGHVGSH